MVTPSVSVNTESVRKYYAKNKDTILYRKLMYRLRTQGAIPQPSTIVKYAIQEEALHSAFAVFAASHEHKDVEIQRKKLKRAIDQIRRIEHTQVPPILASRVNIQDPV